MFSIIRSSQAVKYMKTKAAASKLVALCKTGETILDELKCRPAYPKNDFQFFSFQINLLTARILQTRREDEREE